MFLISITFALSRTAQYFSFSRISDIKNDVHNYFYNYNLSFVDDVSEDGMMARSDVDVDTLALDELNLLKPENTHYDKETVTNLMIIGAGQQYFIKLYKLQ